MKASLSLAVLIIIIGSLFCGCGGGNTAFDPTPTPNPSPSPSSAQNTWTWMAGSSAASQAGVYGTQGAAAPGNAPGARDGSALWTDSAGNVWLFGGIEPPSATQDNFFNDLWKFSGGQWTWMAGSNTVNQPGTYGTLGTAAAGNIPGARENAVTFRDSAGDLWLFGGGGFDSAAGPSSLNDLWKFSGGQWTWMGGSKTGGQKGIYGTRGVAAATNLPGGREFASGATDAAGNFWLFGGLGVDSTGASGTLNDLWEFTGGQWVWVGGSDLANQPANYGVQGTAAPTNAPGARIESAAWVDASGNFWLFGGQTGGATFLPSSDLWKFSGGQWTWMAGPNTPIKPGVYGTLGTAAAANTPGGRVAAAAWTDSAGNLWLFGGNGLDAAGANADLNDLWKFNGTAWTWMGGANLGSPRGNYGTQGTAASSNIPGGRVSAAVWRDAQGNVWIFGGQGEDASGTFGDLNDLWKLQP